MVVIDIYKSVLIYGKWVKYFKKYYVYDVNNEVYVGDIV